MENPTRQKKSTIIGEKEDGGLKMVAFLLMSNPGRIVCTGVALDLGLQ